MQLSYKALFEFAGDASNARTLAAKAAPDLVEGGVPHTAPPRNGSREPLPGAWPYARVDEPDGQKISSVS